MAKRFVESSLWNQRWFHGMPQVSKLFFLFVITYCDHGGLIEYHPELIQFNTGVKDIDRCINDINKEKVRVARWGNYIFVLGFLDFQFGTKKFRARDAGERRLFDVGILDENGRYTDTFKELIKSLETINEESANTPSSSSISISSKSTSELGYSTTPDGIGTLSAVELIAWINNKGMKKDEVKETIFAWMVKQRRMIEITRKGSVGKRIDEDWKLFLQSAGRFIEYFEKIDRDIEFRYAERWANLIDKWDVFSSEEATRIAIAKLLRQKGKPNGALPTEEELR